MVLFQKVLKWGSTSFEASAVQKKVVNKNIESQKHILSSVKKKINSNDTSLPMKNVSIKQQPKLWTSTLEKDNFTFFSSVNHSNYLNTYNVSSFKYISEIVTSFKLEQHLFDS